MNANNISRRRALALAGTTWLGTPLVAEGRCREAASTATGEHSDEHSDEPHRLPPDVTTQHQLVLPSRTLKFSATAGAIRLHDAASSPRADVAFISFQLEGAEKAHRAVTFALNGGPGFSSAWLNVGAVGPWRIPLGGGFTAPSASPEPMANADTWLDFTDLVFIDPAGTGYSQVLAKDRDSRRRLWSVDGDIEYLAEAIRVWLDRYDRSLSPKYLLGESYGGFRVPRLARELAARQETGVSGLILVSPALDFGGRSVAFAPFSYVTRLPSMAAAALAARGPVTRQQLTEVEHYAATDFLIDVTRGNRDTDAIARRSARVAEFTGLDPALVRRYDGLLNNAVFLHELNRKQERVASIYDATITSVDPDPLSALSEYPDPVLDALKAPVSSAMVAIYRNQLNWHPSNTYRLESTAAHREWDWGRNVWAPPQSMEAMQTALALDPRLSVLIIHGLFDLVTPYFGTQLLLDQLTEADIANRVRLSVCPGGHMIYIDDASRTALRDEAARVFGVG